MARGFPCVLRGRYARRRRQKLQRKSAVQGLGRDAQAHRTVSAHRPPPDTIEWEVTVDDTTTWTAPWAFAMDLAKEDHSLFEYACHEGNRALRNIIGTYENRAAPGTAIK